MKQLIAFVVIVTCMFSACNNEKQYRNDMTYSSFDQYPVYNGDDLGVVFLPEKTTFKLWSPSAQEVKVNIYGKDYDVEEVPEETHACYMEDNGVWILELKGNYKDKYYTFQAKHDENWSNEVADPYAKAVGMNGRRGMVVDEKETNPEGWENDRSPQLESVSDIVLYELQIRDFSISPNSGMIHKGKYKAFTESGTKLSESVSTGIDHIAELGVTHVHLLPSYDFRSIDESNLDKPQYNWGYEPQNYNVPEGSFSSDPSDGKVRIREYKEMVQALHHKGLRVVMDVVYNHTENTDFSNFDQLVPDYYYRQWEDGTYSDGAACGNELASEREMVRRFIIESVKYWVKEYHIDGFRFDLMALHDQETMNEIASELRKIDPTIFIYGEGWTAKETPLPENQRALKKYAYRMNDIAVFSDDIRDGIKGSVFYLDLPGFVNGNPALAPYVKFGIVAAGYHPQLDTTVIRPYTLAPFQIINYVSCHDNNTLYDKLKFTLPKANHEELTRLNALSNAIILTSQGIPFLHAGVEMNRTKKGEENSYNLPDSINQIDWEWKVANKDLFHFYQGLIALRKNHPAFRMPTNEMVCEHLQFMETGKRDVIAYQIIDNANNDSWKNIVVAFNGSKQSRKLNLPQGDWTVALQGMEINEKGLAIVNNSYTIPRQSAVILFQE